MGWFCHGYHWEAGLACMVEGTRGANKDIAHRNDRVDRDCHYSMCVREAERG